LELGDEVRIDALGIQGRLRGNLLVTSDPRQPPVGSGELLLEDGRYSAYRQVFEIEQGKLIFAAGPLDDPGLDLRIVRRHPDVTAGMNIAGTAKSPRISLFSDPSYGDDEILSYLLLGRPLNRLDQAEGSMVHTVAKALGLAGGQFIVTRLGAIFGVEEARIERGSRPAETALVLGKQVLPRVKVDYSIGLLGAPNTLRIRYEVGRGWLLQTESGAEAGADLIYTFKKGPGGGG
jgi:translocation and assembly module TamB